MKKIQHLIDQLFISKEKYNLKYLILLNYLMTNITFSVDKELHRRMKEHPEIKWSEIFRQAIRNYLRRLENIPQILTQDLRKQFIDQLKGLNLEDEEEFVKKSKELTKIRTKKIYDKSKSEV